MGRVAPLGPCFLWLGGTGFPLRTEKCAEGSPAREDHVAIGSVEGVAAVVSVQAVGGEQPILVDQYPTVFVFVVDHHVVGVLAVAAIVSTVDRVAAVGGDTDRLSRDAESPAGHVEIVDPVVSDVTVSIIPVDPPVAVKAVDVEASDRGRPQPAIVVDVGRWLDVGDDLAGPSPLDVPGLGDADLTEQAFVQELAGRRGHRTRPHLGTVLHNSPVFFGRRDDCRPLVEDVGHRLFDIDVLAGGQGQQRDPGVPVMGRPDDDNVDVGVFHDILETAGSSRGGLLVPRDDSGNPVHLSRINIAEPPDVDVGGEVAEAAGVGVHDPAATDQSDADRVGRSSPVGQQ